MNGGGELQNVGDFAYLKRDLLGHGAFAVVFKGCSRSDRDKLVAIKYVAKKNLGKSQDLLRKEIAILRDLSTLHHDNVVTLFECIDKPDAVYLIMEFCNGGDLAEYLQRHTKLSEDTISLFFRQVASALSVLHTRGVVHRDLKPQNLLLCHSGGSNPPAHDIRIKIADFGFARVLGEGMMAATLCGSPMYMAPEVILSKQYDGRADLWSVGTIMYQCLTARAPFQANSPKALKDQYERASELVPFIPAQTSDDLRDLLLRTLQKTVSKRIGFQHFFSHAFFSRPRLRALYMCNTEAAERAGSQHSTATTSERAVAQRRGAPSVRAAAPSTSAALLVDQPSKSRCVPLAVPLTDISVDEAEYDAAPFVGDSNDALLRPRGEADKQTAVSRFMLADMRAANPQFAFKTPASNDIAQRRICLPVAADNANSPTDSTCTRDSREHKHVQGKNLLAHEELNVLPSCEKHLTTPGGEEHDFVLVSLDAAGPERPTCIPASNACTTAAISKSNVRHQSSVAAAPIRSDKPQVNVATQSNAVDIPTHRRVSLLATCDSAASSPTKSPGSERVQYDMRRISPAELPAFRAASGVKTAAFDNGTHRIHTVSDLKSLAGNSGDRAMAGANELSEAKLTDRKRGPLARALTEAVFSSSPPSALPTAAMLPPAIAPLALVSTYLDVPLSFDVPELSQDTMLDAEHHELVAKLQLALDICDCLVQLVHANESVVMTISMHIQALQTGADPATVQASEAQRCVERLVLNMKLLEISASCFELLRHELKRGCIKPTKAVSKIVCKLHDLYRKALHKATQLTALLSGKSGMISGSVMLTSLHAESLNTELQRIANRHVSAEQLLFNFAVEKCQTAALDEALANPVESYKQYQMAHAILQCLAEQTTAASDQQLLKKYRDAIERRALLIENQYLRR